MTQEISTLNLTSYNFPLLSTLVGDTAILQNNLDIPRTPSYGRRDDPLKPQLIYCENLLPTPNGYRSCTFSQIVVAATNPVSTAFSEVYNVAASDGALGWFAPAGGSNQIWKGVSWQGTGTYGAGLRTSHANITGQSYICWEYSAVKRVNITANTVSTNTDAGDTLVGISAANIKGICASGNYLIAYDEQSISWSSPSNPMDFTPSLVTGAGTATPSDLKGRIVTVEQKPNGFFIYTTQNVVAARYSGNASYPWVFTPIPGSTGIRSDVDSVTEDLDDASIAWTLDGFQSISSTGVEPVLPELTDFIAAKLLESYNAGTHTLETTVLGTELKVMLHRISKRYLVISYGVTTTFSHALVFDLSLRRWGKIVISHVEVIALPSDNSTADKQLCFVSADGSVKQLLFGADSTTANSLAIIGRIAVTRSSVLTMQEVTVESPKTTDSMTVRIGTSYKQGAKQDTSTVLTQTADSAGYLARKYACRLTGVAHNIQLSGMLNLTSMRIMTTQEGFR